MKRRDVPAGAVFCYAPHRPGHWMTDRVAIDADHDARPDHPTIPAWFSSPDLDVELAETRS